jgi:hypothetical protein
LSLGGTLAVSLINSFTPVAGQEFDILNWGTLSGTFSSNNLSTLSGLTWNTSQLYSTGVISLTSAALLGDYNLDDTVDAADYVLWRMTLTPSVATQTAMTAGAPTSATHRAAAARRRMPSRQCPSHH